MRKTRSSPNKFGGSPSSRGTQLACTQDDVSSSGSDGEELVLERSRSLHRNQQFNLPRNHKNSKVHTDRRKGENSAGESGGPSSPSDAAADTDCELGQPSRTKNRLEPMPIRNKFLNNVRDEAAASNRTRPDRLNILSPRDSGFQSSSGSTADMSPDLTPAGGIGISSQDTYCSDLEDAASQLSATPLVALSTGGLSTVSNSSVASSTMSAAQAMRSISSCSTLNVSEVHASNRITRKRPYSDTESVSPTPHKSSRLQEESFELELSSNTVVPATQDSATSTNAGENSYGLCMMCLTQPKNGVFVHSRFLHLCCCYRCAVKVWNKQKRCPICNCKVKNVMKLFVH